jgi:hypothetical protein
MSQLAKDASPHSGRNSLAQRVTLGSMLLKHLSPVRGDDLEFSAILGLFLGERNPVPTALRNQTYSHPALRAGLDYFARVPGSPSEDDKARGMSVVPGIAHTPLRSRTYQADRRGWLVRISFVLQDDSENPGLNGSAGSSDWSSTRVRGADAVV